MSNREGSFRMLRVLIIDDEPLARKSLEQVLAQRSDVLYSESACDAVQALAKLRERPFDILLLDIEMPELSGLELVESLKQSEHVPSIVFVTAHSEHAVKAFEKRAVDYVLKPFSATRIHEAIDHAKQRTTEQRAAAIVDVLPQMSRKNAKPKLAIKSNGRIVLVDPEEVFSVKAEGNYVLLERKTGSDILRESISLVAEKLKPYGFIRIHRSVLVNSAFVEELHPLFSGDYSLKMKGGREYTVSRSYKKNIVQFAELWIGTEGVAR